MIPKVIHYCWFGGKPLPKSAKKCIASWKKFMPDYEVKEWNESNFDIDLMPYTREAYNEGKYAFVSDVVRFWVLYHDGGVYFDTDVEVVRSIDDIVQRGAMMGWERPDANGVCHVAPGLGLAAPKGLPFYQEMLDGFTNISYHLPDGSRNPYSMIPMINELLLQKGLLMDGSMQMVSDVTIYPADYFCPMDSLTGKIMLTENTHTIHRYTMSWMNKSTQWRVKIMRLIRRISDMI